MVGVLPSPQASIVVLCAFPIRGNSAPAPAARTRTAPKSSGRTRRAAFQRESWLDILSCSCMLTPPALLRTFTHWYQPPAIIAETGQHVERVGRAAPHPFHIQYVPGASDLGIGGSRYIAM